MSGGGAGHQGRKGNQCRVETPERMAGRSRNWQEIPTTQFDHSECTRHAQGFYSSSALPKHEPRPCSLCFLVGKLEDAEIRVA